MSDVRLRIRCSEDARKAWRRACGAFDMSYGQMALNAAKFVLENEDEFQRFVYAEEQSRD